MSPNFSICYDCEKFVGIILLTEEGNPVIVNAKCHCSLTNDHNVVSERCVYFLEQCLDNFVLDNVLFLEVGDFLSFSDGTTNWKREVVRIVNDGVITIDKTLRRDNCFLVGDMFVKHREKIKVIKKEGV